MNNIIFIIINSIIFIFCVYVYMLPVGTDVSKWVHCVCLDINIGILSCLIKSLVISHCINLVTERIYGDFLPSLSIRFFSFLLSRLYGGYEALKGGKTSEAMTDFTGGVVESYDLKKSDISLFDRITRNIKLSSLMSCSIKVKKMIMSM